MNLKNTKESYGALSKAFHWITAFLILGLILLGLYMVELPYDPWKLKLIYFHKSFGLMVLWLVGLRLIWRAFNTKPEPHANHTKLERMGAKLAHIFLYIAMIGMPLTGWLMSSAGQYPVPFFGLQMPDLVGKNPDLAGLMNRTHAVLAYLLIGVIGLHALGALKHHFIDKDSTLKRMAAKPMQRIGPYLIIIILLIFAVGVLKMGTLDWVFPKKDIAEEIKNSDTTVENNKKNSSNEWSIITDQSQITFQASVYNKDFVGKFSDFDGVIIFDPDDLKNSSADIKIKINSIDSDDAERDSQMLGEEWFAIADYSSARFKTTAFEDMGDGRYLAIGNLTIKDKTMPVTLPFQLDIIPADDGSQKAYMEGSVELNRLDFGLGGARWQSGETVSLKVVVSIRLTAFSNK